METYTILHPCHGLNDTCNPNVIYKVVALVRAMSTQDAWTKAQNHNPDYAEFKTRSTCVGDIIMTDEFHMNMVLGQGFRQYDVSDITVDVDYNKRLLADAAKRENKVVLLDPIKPDLKSFSTN